MTIPRPDTFQNVYYLKLEPSTRSAQDGEEGMGSRVQGLTARRLGAERRPSGCGDGKPLAAFEGGDVS